MHNIFVYVYVVFFAPRKESERGGEGGKRYDAHFRSPAQPTNKGGMQNGSSVINPHLARVVVHCSAPSRALSRNFFEKQKFGPKFFSGKAGEKTFRELSWNFIKWALLVGFFFIGGGGEMERERKVTVSSMRGGAAAVEQIKASSQINQREETSQPMLVSLGAHSLSVATLVVVGDGGRHSGCYKVFVSLIYHLRSVSTPGQALE